MTYKDFKLKLPEKDRWVEERCVSSLETKAGRSGKRCESVFLKRKAWLVEVSCEEVV
jgi:hypothetical protein